MSDYKVGTDETEDTYTVVVTKNNGDGSFTVVGELHIDKRGGGGKLVSVSSPAFPRGADFGEADDPNHILDALGYYTTAGPGTERRRGLQRQPDPKPDPGA